MRMKTLALQVPDDIAAQVEAVASKKGVTVEQLLRMSVDEKLARDAELEEAVRDVLAENAELYKRLA
jgi:antitoxin component of RelBE/YafQ-DinJ toxin-antitoxin module